MRRLIDRTVRPILGLPRIAKRAIALALDVSLAIFAVWLAFYLRIGEWVALSQEGWPAAIAAAVIAPPIFIAFGLYRAVFRYAGWDALLAVTQAVFLYGLIYAAIFTAWGIEGVPRTVGLIQPILLLLAVAASRAVGRYWLGGMYRRRSGASRKRVLIYGAGWSGQQLAEAISHNSGLTVAGFVDDDHRLQGSSLGSIRIWSPERLEELVGQLEVSEIFLAVPSASRSRRNEILRIVRQTGVAVKTLPGLMDLAAGKVTVSDIRPLEIEDLLGREAVAPNTKLLERDVRDQVVLVTGAGGSIGSELCRQLMTMKPRRLVLLDSSEFALYAIHRELSLLLVGGEEHDTKVVPLLGSVCDEMPMRQVISLFRPHTVYHAAAYKHVPLVEQNVVAGVRNNVIGTLVMATLAGELGVRRFVLISTDKAVRPSSVMGASKRLAEMILQALAEKAGSTCFTMVRFGNVLGSSGSVVPLFRQQIAAGGPVTVTHPEVTRYFMTIPEAAQLVLHAGAMANGGEVFVLDMGNCVKVYDLAIRMIELAGLKVRSEREPDGDIEIVFTGLRPGEKLYEELLIGNDPAATEHPRVMMASESYMPLETLRPEVERLEAALAAEDSSTVKQILRKLVPEAEVDSAISDWAYLERQARVGDGAGPARVIPLRP